jgi:hypothetical protein
MNNNKRNFIEYMTLNKVAFEFLLSDIENLLYASRELTGEEKDNAVYDIAYSLLSMVENNKSLDDITKEKIKERFEQYNN